MIRNTDLMSFYYDASDFRHQYSSKELQNRVKSFFWIGMCLSDGEIIIHLYLYKMLHLDCILLAL